MQTADKVGPDQLAHSYRLTRTLVVRLQNQRILWYMSTDAHAGLDLMFSYDIKATFPPCGSFV